MPRSLEALSGDAVDVHSLFTTSDRRFRAPEFQRTYVWTAKDKQSEITRFWADLETIMDEGVADGPVQDTLFLGALVLQLSESPVGTNVPLFSVIDGQQRLLTIYLILLSIAEAFEEIEDFDAAEDIEGEYLLVRSGAQRGTPRVEPTLTDTRAFRQVLACLTRRQPQFKTQAPNLDSPHLPSAWTAIRGKVRALCSTDNKLDGKKLASLRDDVLNRVEFVEITIGISQDPHQVYERMNDGGKPLKEIDLVRNIVFMLVGTDTDAAAQFYGQHWGPFEEQLGTAHQDKYFFPLALIRNPQTTKAATYRNLRDYWQSSEVTGGIPGVASARRIMDDLSEFLPSFRALVNLARPLQLSDQSWDKIQVLHRLRVPQTMYPYLMQLLQSHIAGDTTEQELAEAIDIIDSFLARRAVAGIAATGIHTVFKGLWQSAQANHSLIMKRLDARTIQFPNDDDFKKAILEQPVYRSPHCPYLLAEFERGLKGGDTSEPGLDDFTVDHLMPQSARDKGWGGVSKIDADRLVDTWANLVPLTKPANSEKSDRSWDETRAIMIEDPGFGSIFKSTNQVFHEFDDWNADTIAARAESLAEWALTRWPKPPT